MPSNTKEYQDEWYKNNKKKQSEYHKAYYQYPSVKKRCIIAGWIKKGVKCDYEKIYDERYLPATNCEECNVVFGVKGDGSGTFKCLDHDHETGEFRNVICLRCNLNRH